MGKLILFVFIIFIPVAVSAQGSPLYRVSGTITDSLSKPIAGVVIQLSVADENMSVSAAITNQNGEYALQNVPTGEFILSANHLTYMNYTCPCRVAGNMELPTITMSENIQSISTATVTANKVRQSADRYSVSLRNDPITSGKTASEVLGFLPAVSSREGELNIFGQAVSRVRINGVLIEDRRELNAIQAANIDNVEVVYMTGLDGVTTSTGGEINIRLIKPRDGGFYGSVAGNTTMNYRYGNTLNGVNSSFNYGHRKWSIYNYIGYDYNNQFLDQGYLVRYLNTGESNHQRDRTRGWDNNFSSRLSVTYDFNPKHMLGANLRYGRSENAPNFLSQSQFTDQQGTELDRSRSKYIASSLNDQYQATLHYRWKTGNVSEFNLRGDYLRYMTNTDRDYTNTYKLGLPGESTEYMNSLLDNNVDMYYVEAKYTTKIDEKVSLEAGINYNANRTHQLLDYNDMVNGIWVPNNNFNDDYRLRGDNYAAFATLSSTIGKKFTYQVGLRGERREMSYNSHKIGLRNEKNYNVLGGQANLMYMLDPQKGRTLSLSFSRSTSNIPYSALSPVITYLDEYTYSKGNINLEPSIMNSATFRFTLNKNWNFNLAGMSNNNMSYTGVFTDPDDPRVTYSMPVNAGSGKGGALYAGYNFKVAKWWKSGASASGALVRTNTPDGDFTRKSVTFMINNNFDWGKGLGGTLSFYYEPGFQAQVNRRFLTEMSIIGGVYKTLLNNKLRINLQAVIYYLSRDVILTTPDLWRKFYNDRNRCELRLGVTYNFSGGKRVSVKQTSSSQQYIETLGTTKE